MMSRARKRRIRYMSVMLGMLVAGLLGVSVLPSTVFSADMTSSAVGKTIQAVASSQNTAADTAAQLFNAKCIACHTVGGGDQTGPDLKSVVNWLGEDIAANIMEMGTYTDPLKPDEVRALSKLLKDPQAASRIQAAATAGATNTPPKSSIGTMSEKEQGAQLFAQRCVSCHTIGGGESTGPDLNKAVSMSADDLHTNIGAMSDFIGSELKDDQVKSLIALLQDPNAAKLVAKANTLRPEKTTPVTSNAGKSVPKTTHGPQQEAASVVSGTQVFQQKCAKCHTIGNGKLVGPDLAGAASQPAAMLTANVQRMGRFSGGLSAAEVQALVSLLNSSKGGTPVVAAPVGAAPGAVLPMPAASLTVQPATSGDSIAAFFQGKCGSCHTIGHGDLTGPDLAKVKNFSVADLQAKIKGMEGFAGPLPDDKVTALANYLKNPTVAQATGTPSAAPHKRKVTNAAPAPVVVKLAPPSIDIGRQLFTGQTHFQNGGMACVGCHRADGQGGTLGPDLSRILFSLSDKVLLRVCEEPHAEAMQAAYRDHHITHQEALHLAAYFSSLKQHSQRSLSDTIMSLCGIFGAALCVLLLLLAALRGVRENRIAERALERSTIS